MSSEYRVPNSDKFNSLNADTISELDQIYQNHHEVKPQLVAEHVQNIAIDIAEARKNRLDTQFFTSADNKSIFNNSVSKLLFGHNIATKKFEPLTEDILKKEESQKVGSTLFGSRKPGEHVEFFNDNINNWFFYQSINNKGEIESVTLHYEVHPNGILRVSSKFDTPNEFVNGQELYNFKLATEMYHKGVMAKIYSIDPSQKAA